MENGSRAFIDFKLHSGHSTPAVTARMTDWREISHNDKDDEDDASV
jgi:hypothetical protein